MTQEETKPETSTPTETKAAEGAGQLPTKKKAIYARRLLRLSIAFVSFAAGMILGPYTSELITRAHPGFFGPGNQQIIDEQQANFAALQDKLKELRLSLQDDPQAQAIISDLEQMVDEQQTLSLRVNENFKASDVENQLLRDQLLQERGVSGAVDFWIGVGESVSLIDKHHAAAVVSHYTNRNVIAVNVAGKSHQMNVGDVVNVDTTKGPYVLIYRLARRESDGRYGFDFAPAAAVPGD